MWKVLQLDTSSELAARIQKAFENTFIAVMAPECMALFQDNDLSQDRSALYLSPGATTYCRPLLEAYDWQDSPPPKLEKMTLLAGHHDAVELLTATVKH